ncbi:MAG: hypothetical protein ACXVNO_01470 [Bacteroidia bacterium]
MDTTNILLIVNSVLLGLISLPFLIIAYFMKDLHKDFKHMIEKVNKLHSELHTHMSLFENLSKVFQRQIDSLNDRLKKAEKQLHDKER